MQWTKAFGFTVGVAVVFVVLLHTAWPFGDDARHLNNFDSLVHGLTIPAAAYYAAYRWRKQK